MRALALLVLWGVLAGSLLIFSARWFWLGEIAASFAWQFGWVAALSGLLLLSISRARWAVLAWMLSALHAGPELWLWLPDARAGELAERPPELTIASCNLLWHNHDHRAFLEWLDAADPDVLLLLEVSEAWLPSIAELAPRYPHRLQTPSLADWEKKTWGRVFLSRMPMSRKGRYAFLGSGLIPALEMEVLLDGQPVLLRGVHPPRPGKPWRNERRDKTLNGVASLPWEGHAVLLGDLNVTSTSPIFRDVLERSGLRDSRQGFGRLPSYTLRPLPLGVAIDHILVSDTLHVLERRTDPLPGSDHSIAVARLGLR